MTAPAGEVDGVEYDVWALACQGVWKECSRLVEGMEAGGSACLCGESFAVRGGEPRAQYLR